MKVDIRHNFPAVIAAVDQVQVGSRSAVREALNRSTDQAKEDVKREMRRVFDRPTAHTMNSLWTRYASTSKLEVTLWFKDRTHDRDDQWAMPQIAGGPRRLKPMEVRLQRVGIIPAGWYVVPGAAAPLDGYGNVIRGEISRILNVLGTYTEAGYNKANDKTRQRLRKGSAKRGAYGFEYWVNPVGPRRQQHLVPGVYRRVYTSFGTSLKPMLIFVNKANYRVRLHYFRIVQGAFDKHFAPEFDKAMDSLLRTGSASGVRRVR
jgi:hypothetical protein